MSSRQTRQNQPASAPATRSNEYFVPRDGIDREVISADICRYLGNDALVRPGHYENNQTGLVVQGYYITAYRNLTTAMIEDLKADSARWDSERRAQTSRNTPGGPHASRDGSGLPTGPSSNPPAVQYRYSETHQSRQHLGPTEGPYSTDPYSRDQTYDGHARYPGSGAPGYTGASNSFAPPQQQQPQQQQQQQPPPPPPYSSNGGMYSGAYQQTQQSPPPDNRYPTGQGNPLMRPGYQASQEAPYIGTGANLTHTGFPAPSDPYGSRLSSTAPPLQQPTYAPAPSQQSGYPSTSSSFPQFPSQAPSAPGQPFSNLQQPPDPFYGRASPAGQASQQVYATQGQQYDESPHPRPCASPASAQTAPAATSNTRSDRDIDRHHRNPRR